MAPVTEAFGRLWPNAELMHLLDDSLSADRAREGVLTKAMTDRFVTLAHYAEGTGADGVLFTCSAFGPCIEAAGRAVVIPALKPNEAMFLKAAGFGRRIGLLASFEPSISPMIDEFRSLSDAELITACAPEAMSALNSGDGERHDALLAEASRALSDCDAIMLAQFSTARARTQVEAATGRPVLTSPDSAVLAIQAACTQS